MNRFFISYFFGYNNWQMCHILFPRRWLGFGEHFKGHVYILPQLSELFVCKFFHELRACLIVSNVLRYKLQIDVKNRQVSAEGRLWLI